MVQQNWYDWVTNLQLALSLAGYISSTSKLDIKKETESAANPFDTSFDPADQFKWQQHKSFYYNLTIIKLTAYVENNPQPLPKNM